MTHTTVDIDGARLICDAETYLRQCAERAIPERRQGDNHDTADCDSVDSRLRPEPAFVRGGDARVDSAPARTFPEERLSPREHRRIIHAVAKHFRITPAELLAHSRIESMTIPRRAWAAVLNRAGCGSSEIGHAMHRDHSTAAYLVQRARASLKTDPVFRRWVESLTVPEQRRVEA